MHTYSHIHIYIYNFYNSFHLSNISAIFFTIYCSYLMDSISSFILLNILKILILKSLSYSLMLQLSWNMNYSVYCHY